ncbi:MAG: hypothetical protein WCI21_03850 [Alphaproteobacteria bacterium]
MLSDLVDPFTPLERASIEAICVEHPVLAEGLRNQSAAATVTSRDNTGVGFFTYFEVASSVAPLPSPFKSPLGTVSTTVVGVEMYFMVWVSKEGFADCIEGYTMESEDFDLSEVDLATVTFPPFQRVVFNQPAPGA